MELNVNDSDSDANVVDSDDLNEISSYSGEVETTDKSASVKHKTTEVSSFGIKEDEEAEEEEEETSKRDVFPTKDAKTIPFYASWVFGVDMSVKLVNLTKREYHCELFYAVSHIGVLYDHKNNEMRFLIGHKNAITGLSTDIRGKWLVTGDCDIDNNLLIVWDSEECIPVHTIFNAHPKSGIAQVEISWDAKYLVSVGNETDPIVKVWLWTFGRNEADDSFTAKSDYGQVKHVSFNPNKSEHFLVTFDNVIVFFSWENDKLITHVPELDGRKMRTFGTFSASTYIEFAYECLSATSNGWVVIWDNTFYARPFDPNVSEMNNKKMFIKAFRLQKEAITFIGFIDGVIGTGDSRGNIRFYDRFLKLLYWCQNFRLPNVFTLNFNLHARQYVPRNPYETNKSDFDSSSSSLHGGEELEDRSDDNERIYMQLLPSDYTLERAPFLVRDFLVVTADGDISYVHYVGNHLEKLIINTVTAVTAIAVHNDKPLLTIGYLHGFIITYNYETRELIVPPRFIAKRVKCKENSNNDNDNNDNDECDDDSDSDDDSTDDENSVKKKLIAISSIQYSPRGLFMACGTSEGHIWFLEPSINKPLSPKPFIYDSSSVLGVRFSPDNLYLAYYDSSMAVCLLKRYKDKWVFHGRYIAHFKPVKELLFCHNSRLFSLSGDRHLVEYDVINSEPGKLELLMKVCIMQIALPITFILYDFEPNILANLFIVSSNENKYNIFNDVTYALERMFLSPLLGPVQQMKLIPGTNKKYMVFTCNKYIGVQLLPLTGNPFEHVALIGHHNRVEQLCVSSDGKYLFTVGTDSCVCMMWSINTDAVDTMAERGGKELNPYLCLLEGGSRGWLFQELQDLFYYMQILHQGENSPAPRSTSNRISTSEIPNLIRAVGVFPSEYAMNNILYEVKYYLTEMSENNEEEISFEDFVKLFINHRLEPLTKITELEDAFNHFACRGFIRKNQLFEMLCSQAEEFEPENLQHCFKVLLNQTSIDVEYENILDLLPEEIVFSYFLEDILGVDVQINDQQQDDNQSSAAMK